ncbi:phosphotransferase enzyme family domain-containing protein [Pochonia chlamydosporia 170]|uniref:Phosphotransferase enzyme family domain-containing protein n=1 Tax=Pochonia chlamydosporia 170 TaxID=1380566 RepID=A0A179F5M9_METCM|nr:phosphotransferase enzyme family domain-containing protein [Pochonia chlamydosporia 170]OAQ60737.1 phosphotransferase enzyme family domain-containing protein [Pochonia chlamydosporia 170]
MPSPTLLSAKASESMARPNIQHVSSLETYFDEIEVTNGDNECRVWSEKLLDAIAELAAFVASRREGGPATEYVELLKGSFNMSFRFRFDDEGPDAIIRFPKPGHTATALRDEKLANEVRIMEYISQNTTIPIPRIHSWGTTAESSQQFGPFIIMDFVEGMLLSEVLKRPTESDQEDFILNPDVDKTMLEKVYRQIAGYILQLSQLHFSHIGSISKEPTSNEWVVTGRPVTYNMNELVSVSGCPSDNFPTTSFNSAADYLKSVSVLHLDHVWAQHNIADNAEIAEKRYIARRRMPQLIDKYCIENTGPFLLFCDDLRPSNILINPDTLEITALIDLEYTNAMPAQFTYDPPWWLLLSGPEFWLDRGCLEEFNSLYELRMEQFLQALEEVESTSCTGKQLEPPLSARMRDSWANGRFWFNYAMRKSFELDSIYWAVLHEKDTEHGQEEYPEMEKFIATKMEQLEKYRKECAARSST